jgi:hypothetical protein
MYSLSRFNELNNDRTMPALVIAAKQRFGQYYN